MAVKSQTIINYLEKLAPKSLAEDWDNVGLQIGSPAADISRVLVTLDVNREVVEEALTAEAGMIISHHPLFYKPVKNLRSDTPFGALVEKIIKNGLVVYSAHTNLDSAREGVNTALAKRLLLKDIQVLNPDKEEELVKLVVFLPEGFEDVVRKAITNAGAGYIGNYSDCTFMVDGIGTFRGMEGTNPFIGKPGALEEAREKRLETIMPKRLVNSVVKAMLKAHPYEEVAYDIYPLLNKGSLLGLGRIGVAHEEKSLEEYAEFVKEALNLNKVRVVGEPVSKVKKVAVCGGSGGSLIHKAHFAGADLLVTGDIKYHEAQEAEALGLNLIDAGHNGTEVIVIPELVRYLSQCLAKDNVEVMISTVNTDPFDFI